MSTCQAQTAHDRLVPPAAVAAQPQGERKGHRSRRKNVQVSRLLDPPRRVGEPKPANRRPGHADTQLARERVRTGHGHRVGEEEGHVVGDERAGRSSAEEAERGVAHERVGERERVVDGIEDVRVP